MKAPLRRRAAVFAVRSAFRLVMAKDRILRPVTIGVKGMVVSPDGGSVLLIRQTYLPGLHLPGGGVKRGETTAEAVVREVREEAGVETLGLPRLLGVYSGFHLSKHDHVAVFVIERWRFSGGDDPESAREAAGSPEIEWSGFCPLDRLPEGTSPSTVRRSAELLGRATIDFRW